MKRALASLLVLWTATGGVAAFQRGDFGAGNCSTAADTALVVVMGPINYTDPDTLRGTCIQPD